MNEGGGIANLSLDAFEAFRELDDEALRTLIVEGTPSQKVWAAWQLALSSGSGADAALTDAMCDEPTSGVRAHWIIVLFSHGESELVAVLAQHDPSPLVRETAARYLAPTAGRAEAVTIHPALASCLSDAAPRVRQTAVRHLASEPGTALLNRVHQMVADPDAQVRMASLEYLLTHHGQDVQAIGAYVADPDVHVRRRALEAMASIRPPDLSWALERVLVEEDEAARDTLVAALLEANQESALALALSNKAPLAIHDVFAPLARVERRFSWEVMAPLFGACPDSPTLLALCACVETATIPLGSAVALIDEATAYYEGEELWLPHLIQITRPLLETLSDERRAGFPALRALLVDELRAARVQRWGPIETLEALLQLLPE